MNRNRVSALAWGVLLAFFTGLCVLVALDPAWGYVLGLYLIASVVAFILYARDKKLAEQNSWRVSENTLHLVALLGGWPGALYAQQHLRHKTKKMIFQLVFCCTIALNLVLLGYFIFL